MTFGDQSKKKALDMASRMACDFDEEKAVKFEAQHGGQGWYENFKLLRRMLTHPEYRLSPATWVSIAGALAYVICPVDIIPDIIPVLGWVDDAFVLTMVMASVSAEIEDFKLFLEHRRG